MTKLNVLADIFENFYSQLTILVTIYKATEVRTKLTTFEYIFALTKFGYTFEFYYSVFIKWMCNEIIIFQY